MNWKQIHFWNKHYNYVMRFGETYHMLHREILQK